MIIDILSLAFAVWLIIDPPEKPTVADVRFVGIILLIWIILAILAEREMKK